VVVGTGLGAAESGRSGAATSPVPCFHRPRAPTAPHPRASDAGGVDRVRARRWRQRGVEARRGEGEWGVTPALIRSAGGEGGISGGFLASGAAGTA
jgi:hypothetical protein